MQEWLKSLSVMKCYVSTWTVTGNQTCPDDVAPALIPAGMQPQDKPGQLQLLPRREPDPTGRAEAASAPWATLFPNKTSSFLSSDALRAMYLLINI